MADLLIIVPSRGRPQAVARLYEAWTNTHAYDDGAALVFATDGDDPMINDYRRAIFDLHMQAACETPQWVPMVPKLNRVARDVVNCAEPFAVGFAGDDHLPRTVGWAKRYLDELRQLHTGIVYGNDLLQGERIPTQWAMTSDIVWALGRMVPAPVQHLCCDSAIYDLGHAADCIRYLPDVVIEHMHPAAGKAPEDDTYRLGNNPTRVADDGAAYRHWRNEQLAHDAAIVKELTWMN